MKFKLSIAFLLVFVVYCSGGYAAQGLTTLVVEGHSHDEPSYSPCKFNEGLEIKRILDGVFFNGSRNINPHEGTVEFWFLPEKKLEEYRSGSTLLHLKESFDENEISRIAILIRNRRLVLELSIQDEKIPIRSAELEWDGKKPHHIAFTWGRAFIRFFVDGRNVGIKRYDKELPDIKYDILLGGNRIRPLLYAAGVYDEFRVSDIVRTQREIENSYTNNREFDIDKNTLLLAHLNNSIEAIGVVTEWKKSKPKIYADVNGTKKFFFNTNEAYIYINIYNQTDRLVSLKTFYEIKGINNSVNAVGEQKEMINEREKRLLVIPIIEKIPYGYYDVKIKVEEGKQIISNLDTNIAVVRDLSGKVSDASFFGLCVSGHDLIRNSEFVSRLGFKWVSPKHVFHWYLIEPKEGSYDWDYPDRVVMAAEESNINLMALIHGNPPAWVMSSPGIPKSLEKKPRLIPDDQACWMKYVSKVVERYKDNINYWEIWNEPDWWMTGEKYYNILKSAFEEIKKNPSMNVVTGGFVVAVKHRKYPYRNFIEDFKDNGGNRYYDILGFHLYGGFKNFLKYSKFLNKGINKPVWITEWGLKLNRPFRKINKYEHASEAMKRLITSMSSGVKRFFWFYYSDVLKKNNKFGLVDSTNTPRPILSAFNNIIHLLGGSIFVADITEDGKKFRAYNFMKEDREVIVAWSNEIECRVPIDKFGEDFIAYDFLGNKVEKDQLIVSERFLNLTDKPLYLVIQ